MRKHTRRYKDSVFVDLFGEEEFCAIYRDCQEIIKILVAITKHRNNG